MYLFCLQFLFETFFAPVTNKPITRMSDCISTQKGMYVFTWVFTVVRFQPKLLRVGKVLAKVPNVQFHENLFSRFRVVTCSKRYRCDESSRDFFFLTVRWESSPTRNVITRSKGRCEIDCKVTENVLTEILYNSLRASRRVIHPTYPPTSSKTKVEMNWKTLQVVSRNRLDCWAQSLTLILRRSRTGTVWFYTSTSNKRAAWPKLYTDSLTRDLKLMYSRLTLVRISINLYAPCVLYIGTGVSLLFRERFLYI